MNMGISYLTTKRHNGKPVYKILVDLGQLVDGSTSTNGLAKYKSLTLTNATPIKLEWIVRNADGTQFINVPVSSNDGKVILNSRIIYDSSKVTVYAICTGNCLDFYAQFILEYTVG
jgi:hypothetical protein